MVNGIRRSYRRYDRRFTTLDARTAQIPPLGAQLLDGIPFECRDRDGSSAPLLLCAGCEDATIPVDADVTAVAVLGHTALKGGYPTSSVFSVHHRDAEPAVSPSDPAAEYEFLWEDGSEKLPLRHGLEVVRSNDICRWWKTAPRAPHTTPALRTIIDPSYEILRIDLWRKTFRRSARLKSIRWRLLDEGAVFALYALSVRIF